MEEENKSRKLEGSLFYRTLRNTLYDYRIDFNEFASSSELSEQYKSCLRRDEGLGDISSKFLKAVICNLRGRVQPKDLVRVMMSGIYSEEQLRDAEWYFEGLGLSYTKGLDDVWSVVRGGMGMKKGLFRSLL